MALGPTQLPTGRGLLPTELTGMWGWILLRSPHWGRGSAPAPAPTEQRPDLGFRRFSTPPRQRYWSAYALKGTERQDGLGMQHNANGRGGRGGGGGPLHVVQSVLPSLWGGAARRGHSAQP